MSIFQKSIVDKYLAMLDSDLIDDAYHSYKQVYSEQKIKRIKTLKEEQYQSGFLKDIFGSVLGYTIDPEFGYNIELEKKNETNSKKADGAIVKDEKVLGVIELKSNSTKNLESIKDQAFGYKYNHKGCKYVISSNFHKLRFYVDDATDFEEFDLYNLDKETFKKFYLFLRKEGLLDKNVPKLLKEETKFHEENISKQLYKDYSIFKNKFFENIVKNNPHHDKLLLFKKSQKFLDRILFILFAEDKELVPVNTISRIVENWVLADDLLYKPLYELFTILFEHLNVGHTYKDGYEIPAYNGGLFAPDEILDNLKVDDEILKDDLLILSKYDFNTDVDVNILGHIFEHSLNEIEEIEAELRGEEPDKSKGKRKKDGVFYTPKYITKYIVDNTVGKLCSTKKRELSLDIDIDIRDYQKSNGSVNTKGKGLFKTLESYKDWLLQLKILDPACGSGAFLNQALTFLIEEHKNIDDLIAELTNTPLRIFDTDKSILENNIFGVDINEESVEIAKLSLWLRTAQQGRKLSNLNNNIKCGNSLIDDQSVAGDKSFNWEKEYPKIFENGGFDVVIGNPPYVKRQNLSDEIQIDFLETKYQSATYNFDLYLLFIELGSKILNKHGLLSYINPSKFTSTKTGEGLRNYLESNCHILKYIDFKEYQVFEDATTYCCIFILNNDVKGKTEYFELNDNSPQIIESFSKNRITISNSSSGIGWQFKDTINIKGDFKVKDISSIFTGIETGADDVFVIKKSNPIINLFNDPNNIIIHPLLKGTNADRYYHDDPQFYVLVPYKKDRTLIDSNEIKANNPIIWEYLNTHIEKLKIRDKGRMNTEKWYGFVYPKNLHKFDKERIIWSDISIRPQFSIDKNKNWHVRTLCSLELNDIGTKHGFSLDFLVGIFNSKLLHYFILNNSNTVRGGYLRYRPQYIKEFPLPKISNSNLIDNIVVMVNLISSLTFSFMKKTGDFRNYLSLQFTIENLSKKLQNWEELEFVEFIKELNKSIKKIGGEKLTKMDEMDWMDVFDTKKEEVQNLKFEIDKVDKEIDQMVYDLYSLTEEEIKIVEES